MRNHKILEALLNFSVLLLVCISVFVGAVYHVRTHLKSISDNTDTVLTNHNRVLSNTNMPSKTIIFYRDSCPHCQHVIPYVYLLNKLSNTKFMMHKASGNGIQYRDLNTPKNELMADRLNAQNSFPDARTVAVHHGHVVNKHESIWQTSRLRLITISILGLLILIISACSIASLI